MQENNFETIISSWRRMSGEQVEHSAIESMSGDSHSNQPFKKKDEESNLLVLERPKGPIATAASAGTVVATVEATQSNVEPTVTDDKQEKQEFTKFDKDDSKEAAGDAAFVNEEKEGKEDDSKSYLENDNLTSKSPDGKWEKEKGDKVDSVYLRPPPPHKVQSNTSANEDEDCGIKCLYYTLQCCDCVLM